MSHSKPELDHPDNWKSEGFPGQRITRLPTATAETCASLSVIQDLYPESIGQFPRAPGHGVSRPQGIDNQLLILCTSGLGFLEIKGNRHDIKAGQIALIPRNVPHRYGASLEQPWGKYWTHFTGRQADTLMELLRNRPSVYVYDLQQVDVAIRCFEELYHWALKAHTEETLLQIHGALLSWILCILRLRGKTEQRPHANDAVLKAVHNMQQDCSLTHSPAALAKACGMSEASFYRSFKQHTNCTPVKFLAQVRMQNACQLLDLTEKPIAEIGQSVGYEDPYYFSRVFSTIMGMSPKRYRNSDIGSSTWNPPPSD